MVVLCSWCIKAGQPSFVLEKPPYENTDISHGMCAAHEVEWRAQAAALPDRRAAKAAV